MVDAFVQGSDDPIAVSGIGDGRGPEPEVAVLENGGQRRRVALRDGQELLEPGVHARARLDPHGGAGHG